MTTYTGNQSTYSVRLVLTRNNQRAPPVVLCNRSAGWYYHDPAGREGLPDDFDELATAFLLALVAVWIISLCSPDHVIPTDAGKRL